MALYTLRGQVTSPNNLAYSQETTSSLLASQPKGPLPSDSIGAFYIFRGLIYLPLESRQPRYKGLS